MIDPSARIHPSADLEDDVTVGPGTTIWHRAQIRVGATIGADCVIGRDAFIDEGVVLGDRVKVQNGALIYHGVTVGDGVFIGPGAILTNDRLPAGDHADRRPRPGRRLDGQPDPPRRRRSIGAGAVVVAGCDVGPYAMVGAGAVVTRDVPAHALVVGNPGPPDRLGLRLRRSAWSTRRRSAPAEPGRYAARTRAVCGAAAGATPTIPDAETLEERVRPASRSARMIPIARPDIGPEEIAAVTEVLASGMLAQGREGRRARGALGRVRRRPARDRGQPTGRVALMCDLRRASASEPGDEVITVGHTFDATANAILSTGATPVFVDIEPDTYLIDAERIEAAITPRTRAICPVHLFGLPADMDMIPAIADRHGLASSRTPARPTARRSAAGGSAASGTARSACTRTKNMTTGEGGFITTERRPPGRLAPALPEPGHARALPARDARLQLPADRHRRRDRPVPARQAASATRPAGRRSPPRYDDGVRRPADPDCRSRPTAGPTSSTSTRSTSGGDRDAIVADLARGRRRRRASTTRSRSTARRTSWSAGSTPTCR